MHPEEHGSRDILTLNRPLLRRIVAITSRRRHLTEEEETALSRFVVTEMSGPEGANRECLGTFRGYSSVTSPSSSSASISPSVDGERSPALGRHRWERLSGARQRNSRLERRSC